MNNHSSSSTSDGKKRRNPKSECASSDAHAARKRKERTISDSDKHETKCCRPSTIKNRYEFGMCSIIFCAGYMQNCLSDRAAAPFYHLAKFFCQVQRQDVVGWHWWQARKHTYISVGQRRVLIKR